MRALVTFAGFTGMRPGEMFALEWSDVEFEAMRIDVRRRLYRGKLDLPKSNKVRRIALTPPARDALLTLPSARDGLVFRSKRGLRLSQPTLSGYWGKVTARANLEFDFYLATKHHVVHYLHASLGLPPWVIAEQMGWTLVGVLKLLAVYGHGDVGPSRRSTRPSRANVITLRAVDSDATQMQTGA
jgi:integrase